MPDPAANAHDEAEVLLPWYATGELDKADRALVERHLATCVECRRQLRFDERMIAESRTLDPQVDSGWARLQRRLEPTRSPQSPSRAWRLLKHPAVATLAAAQVAFVIIAGAVLLALPRPQYQALGSASASPAANAIVMFHADAAQKDVLAALREEDATVVGGPTTTGGYLIHLPADRRADALARLRSGHDVQLAQPIDGAAQ